MGNNKNINNNSHQATDDRAPKRTTPTPSERDEAGGRDSILVMGVITYNHKTRHSGTNIVMLFTSLVGYIQRGHSNWG